MSRVLGRRGRNGSASAASASGSGGPSFAKRLAASEAKSQAAKAPTPQQTLASGAEWAAWARGKSASAYPVCGSSPLLLANQQQSDCMHLCLRYTSTCSHPRRLVRQRRGGVGWSLSCRSAAAAGRLGSKQVAGSRGPACSVTSRSGYIHERSGNHPWRWFERHDEQRATGGGQRGSGSSREDSSINSLRGQEEESSAGLALH